MKFIRSISLFCLAALAFNASAVPAKRVTLQKAQPDGSTVTLTLMGDENCHYYMTQDDKMVVADGDAYFFATVNANGILAPSEVLAANPGARNSRQLQFVERMNLELLNNAIRNTALSSVYKQEIEENIYGPAKAAAAGDNTWSGKGIMRDTRFPTKGNIKGLAILAEYSDVTFSQSDEDTYTYFNRLLNETGFSELGATGSAADYFKDNSCGVFEPEFVVLGPVTLPNKRAYYGNNNASGHDLRPAEMIRDALAILYEQGVDFAQFDNDGDQRIDNVFVFYAGEGEAQTGVEEAIWPHTSKLTSWGIGSMFGYKLGTVYADAYACASELVDANGTLDGIGTFTHEFSHVLGLPDLYDTVNSYATYTPSDYSIMDSGPYNNNSRTPPCYSIFERNALEWIEPELINSTMDLTLEHIATSNAGYVITTDNDDEFYLLENRQKTGWDTYIPGHGMVVWHIDYKSLVFRGNTVNNNQNHQYVDLVEACGYSGSSTLAKRKYPFPGTGKVTSWTDDTTPSMCSWSGTALNLPITDITETDGVITAKATNTAGISSIVSDGLNITINGREISVGDTHAVIFDSMGRIAAQGTGILEVSCPGLYIISISGNSAKVMIK